MVQFMQTTEFKHLFSKYKLQDKTSIEYWENHYKTKSQTETFDWLLNWNDFNSIVENNAIKGMYINGKAVTKKHKIYIRKGLTVLVIGCGNSTLSEDMYDEGY